MLLFLPGHVHHPYLRSFPTRRSSDLARSRRSSRRWCWSPTSPPCSRPTSATCCSAPSCCRSWTTSPRCTTRSEEHTSELQSHSDLVCRLLLEKKNRPITSGLFTDLAA